MRPPPHGRCRTGPGSRGGSAGTLDCTSSCYCTGLLAFRLAPHSSPSAGDPDTSSGLEVGGGSPYVVQAADCRFVTGPRQGSPRKETPEGPYFSPIEKHWEALRD